MSPIMSVMLTNDWDGPAETPDSSHFPASVLVLPLPFTWSGFGLDVAPPSHRDLERSAKVKRFGFG